MSQATPATFSVLFKHTHGGHKTGIGVPAVIQFSNVGGHCEAMLDISKNTNFYREFHEVFTRIEKKNQVYPENCQKTYGPPYK